MKKLLLAIMMIGALCSTTKAQKTWVAGGGTGSGNWSVAANWSGGTLPTATDSVVISITNNSGATITIDGSAVCRALYMIGSGSVAGTGPTLQFASPPVIPSLTVFGGLSITGGSGSGTQGGRPKLTSNGNGDAILILNGYNGVTYTTSASNTNANGSAGLNMNEGIVRIIGTGIANVSLGAGARLGDLQIGNGINAKVVNFIQTNTSTLTITSLIVKAGSTFNVGNTANNLVSNIGSNNITGVPNWYGGLTVETGASLLAQSATGPSYATFNIFGGDIINNGTISLSNTNRFINVNIANTNSNTRTRTIGGTSPVIFRGLLLNDTNATINVLTPITINDTIVFNSGKLVNTSPVTLSSNITVAGGNTNSFVSGPLRHTWSTATATKFFPLGKGNIYRPVSFALTTPVSPIISAEVFNTNSAGTFAGGTLSQSFYYQTALISGTATSGGSVIMNFIPSIDGVQNTSTLGVGQATTVNGAYTNIGNSISTSTSVTSSPTYNPASGNFLSLLSTASNTLPVVFKFFTGSKEEGSVHLKWSTASESNNKGFEIQRSLNGAKYQAVGFVKGSGNSNITKTYSFTDVNNTTGNVCYRLKQIDFNGVSEFSKVTCVNIEAVKTTEVITTPNPFYASLNVKYNSLNEGSANMQIIDMLGKTHQNSNMIVNKGENTLTIDTEVLPLGIYFIRITNGTEVTTQRIVKR